jgi:hypothetical protein
MAQADSQTTTAEGGANALPVSDHAKLSDELKATDQLDLCLRLAKGIIGVARERVAVTSADEARDDDLGSALYAAYQQLEGAEAATERLNEHRQARIRARETV